MKRTIIKTKDIKDSDNSLKLTEIIESYKEDIKWDDNTGEFSINDIKQIPFEKQIWIPNRN